LFNFNLFFLLTMITIHKRKTIWFRVSIQWTNLQE
jgi:hypothetical protein